MHIVFVTRDLEIGGAQRQLALLASGLSAEGHRVQVATLYAGGPLESDLPPDVDVLRLEKRGRGDTVGFLPRAIRTLRATRPDVLHGYRSAANLLVSLSAPFVPGARVVLGLRSSKLELGLYDRADRISNRLESRFGRLADRIICNSEAGRRSAIARGFDPLRIRVVPNAVDTTRFRFVEDVGARLREKLGIPVEPPLVGLIARFDVKKDHRTFLAAGAHLAGRGSTAQFLCMGPGSQQKRAPLEAFARELGIGERVHFREPHPDLPAVYSALDRLCLPSAFGEGFPNVIAEAMACGVPCIVTDTGDCASIVARLGCVVPPRDPEALARALEASLLHPASAARRAALRSRMQEQFSPQLLVQRTLLAIQPEPPGR